MKVKYNNVSYHLQALIATYGISTVLIELGKLQEKELLTSDYVLDPDKLDSGINECIIIDENNPALYNPAHPMYGKVMVGETIKYTDHLQSPIIYDNEEDDEMCADVLPSS